MVDSELHSRNSFTVTDSVGMVEPSLSRFQKEQFLTLLKSQLSI